MDVRTERYRQAQPPQLISARQMQALRGVDCRRIRGGLKFVVSAVPFFPDLKLGGWAMGERNDKWAGFQQQRQHLPGLHAGPGRAPHGVPLRRRARVVLERAEEQLEAGTSACTPSSRRRSTPPPSTRRSSSSSTRDILDGQTDYQLTRHGGYTRVSNFTRLSWKEPTLRVEIFDRKGKRLHEASLNLDA